MIVVIVRTTTTDLFSIFFFLILFDTSPLISQHCNRNRSSTVKLQDDTKLEASNKHLHRYSLSLHISALTRVSRNALHELVGQMIL